MARTISQRFAGYIQANLDYWLAKTAGLDDASVGALAAERHNIFRAVHMGLALLPSGESAIRMALQVFPLVELNGYWQEWIPMLEQALELPGAAPYRAKLLEQLGFLYRLVEDLDQAITIHEEAARQAQMMGDTGQLARIYFSLGTDCREARAYADAERYARLAGQAFQESGTAAPRNQAAIANLLGLIAQHQGHFAEALDHYDTAVHLWQKAGQAAYLARTLLNKGLTLQNLVRYAEALAVYDQADQILDGAGLELDKVPVAINRGNIHYHLGQWQQAIAAYRAADTAHLQRSGRIHNQALIATNLGHVYLEMDDLIQAAAYLEKGIVLWQQSGDAVQLANALCTAGDVQAKLQHEAEARAYYQEALQLVEKYTHDVFAREVEENSKRGLTCLQNEFSGE